MANLVRALEIEGWMHPDELEWLATEARKSKTIVEIGAWKGRSTRALGDNTSGQVFTVDHWQGSKDYRTSKHLEAKEAFNRNLADLIESGKVVPLEHNSQLGLPLLLEQLLPGKVDFLFVDGDHSYEACLHDIKVFGPLVRAGGIISGHDYHHVKHPGVEKAVTEWADGPVQLVRTIWWTHI